MVHFFDLHCDTVYECMTQKKSLLKNDLHLDLERGNRTFTNWVQTFAFWIPDHFSEAEQYDIYQRELACFRQFERLGGLKPYTGSLQKECCNYLLAVEGGGMLGDDLSRIKKLKEAGICFFTLTWNDENRIGGGAKSDAGLSGFGREVVKELEENRIIVDVSHLNRKTFWDVCKTAQKPFVATHSNADAICPHPRNLKKGQITEITARGGLIGLNLFHEFLSGEKEAAKEDFLRHIEYFCENGAGDYLAIGTDFDGAAMPKWINGVEGIENLVSDVVKYFGKEVAKQLFYENAAAFFRRIDMGKN